MRTFSWTLAEVAALVPQTPILQLAQGQLASLRTQGNGRCSIWGALYQWLAHVHGYEQRELHNITYVGDVLMTRLLRLERLRLQHYEHLQGTRLARALTWSNGASGPM